MGLTPELENWVKLSFAHGSMITVIEAIKLMGLDMGLIFVQMGKIYQEIKNEVMAEMIKACQQAGFGAGQPEPNPEAILNFMAQTLTQVKVGNIKVLEVDNTHFKIEVTDCVYRPVMDSLATKSEGDFIPPCFVATILYGEIAGLIARECEFTKYEHTDDGKCIITIDFIDM
ncbi:MAG: hypothetical protein GY870_17665 [archaeon]|nr:hypothetical protein [archaeon]